MRKKLKLLPNKLLLNKKWNQHLKLQDLDLHNLTILICFGSLEIKRSITKTQCAITLSNLANMKNIQLPTKKFKNQEQEITKDQQQEVKPEKLAPIQLSIDRQPLDLRFLIAHKAFLRSLKNQNMDLENIRFRQPIIQILEL